MTTAMHIIDATTPRDMLMQLALLSADGDVIVSVGPAPTSIPLGRPVRAVHCPLGISALAGGRLADIAGQTRVVHAWSAKVLPAAADVARRRGCPLWLSLPAAPTGPAATKLLKQLRRSRACVLTTTESQRQALLSAGADNVNVLPPAAVAVADRAASRARVREELGIGDDERLLVAPAPMTRGAGHEIASWAHGILRQVFETSRLLLPGGGPIAAHVDFFAHTTGYNDEVFLPGDRYTTAEALAAADMALFFYQRPSGASAPAAAMAAGVPIVGSATGDLAELCPHEQAAMLVPPDDPQAATAILMRLTDDAALGERLGKNAAAIAAEKFTPEVVGRKLREIYAATVKKS